MTPYTKLKEEIRSAIPPSSNSNKTYSAIISAIDEYREELAKSIEAELPEDSETHGYEILEQHANGKNCCPGDDVGLGYEIGIKDAAHTIRDSGKGI